MGEQLGRSVPILERNGGEAPWPAGKGGPGRAVARPWDAMPR